MSWEDVIRDSKIEVLKADAAARIEPALEIQAIKRLRLRPGDIIVLKSKANLSLNYMEHISKTMKEQFPENKVIVFEGGMDIEVISCEKD